MDLPDFTLTKKRGATSLAKKVSTLSPNPHKEFWFNENKEETDLSYWEIFLVTSQSSVSEIKKTFPTNPKINSSNKNVIRYLSRSLVG